MTGVMVMSSDFQTESRGFEIQQRDLLRAMV